jgi:mannose-6-phosphate isomerase-like protein (cupin superfamily)
MASRADSVKKKDFDNPDERRDFSHGHLDIVRLGETEMGRLVMEKGWRWSQDVKPIAKTESCQVHHVGFQSSGRMHVRMDDGTELDVEAGDAVDIPPGHDAWVEGDETAVLYQFAELGQYAKKR